MSSLHSGTRKQATVPISGDKEVVQPRVSSHASRLVPSRLTPCSNPRLAPDEPRHVGLGRNTTHDGTHLCGPDGHRRRLVRSLPTAGQPRPGPQDRRPETRMGLRGAAAREVPAAVWHRQREGGAQGRRGQGLPPLDGVAGREPGRLHLEVLPVRAEDHHHARAPERPSHPGHPVWDL